MNVDYSDFVKIQIKTQEVCVNIFCKSLRILKAFIKIGHRYYKS